ncbi:uncharacterized protein LOC117124218 isoform X2 [Anneissia japonica]|nr:uncharacterized protein LOC117124218 isoform X2 [Anneissia japonica]
MWLDRVDSMNDSTLRDVSSTNLSCTSDNVFETKSHVPHQQPDLREDNTNGGSDANEKEDNKELNEEQTTEEETPEMFASLEHSFLHKYLRPGSCSSLALTPKQNPEIPGVKRRCSCVDFRQFDKPETQEEKNKPAKETLHYSLRKHQPVGQRYCMDARLNKITHSESLPNIQQQPVRKHKEKEKFYSLRTKRKQKLHSGLAHPTLSSLMKPIDMKIQNSATAIRLATYGKIKGSSREDLTTGISEVSDEDTRSLDWTDSAHSRKKLLSSSSTKSIEALKRSQKSIKKKSKPTDDSQDLSDIAEIDSINSEDGLQQRTITEADIPITPVLIFFFSYVILGAVMFYFLEKGWNLPNAIYFCFITLTTIGFGDYVPDSSLYSLIACCIYTAVGMAITSMCIALIMKKFVLQVKKLGRKIGILKDEVDV